MVVGPDIASAQPCDSDEIDALLRAAFGQPDEAELVRRLRADGAMWAEFVIRWQRVIAAHAALSRMRAPEGWACLAPVAVRPRFQRGAAALPGMTGARCFHLGTRLAQWAAMIASDFSQARDRDGRIPAMIVVLGSVPFYERAGFSAARAARLRSPYPVEHTLLAGPGDAAPEATLVYPRAFDAI